jgi:hypothetical protein
MFIVASFSVAGGLRTSMDKLKDSFSEDTYLVTMPGQSGPEFFDQMPVNEIAQSSSPGILIDATLEPYGTLVTVFAVSESQRTLSEHLETNGPYVLAGESFLFAGNAILRDQAAADVNISGRFSSTIFPSDWLLCSVETLQTITGQSGKFNFVIINAVSIDQRRLIEDLGFYVQPLTGIVEFLDTGVRELESDAFWVLIPSSFVIAVLAYAFIGSETVDRRHDIGIMKTIGAGRWRVLSYLMTNALIISAWGGLVGVALGIVLSYGVSTVASSLFTSVFVVKASESLLLVSFASTLGASLVGALGPALKMTLTSPVDDLKEATR